MKRGTISIQKLNDDGTTTRGSLTKGEWFSARKRYGHDMGMGETRKQKKDRKTQHALSKG